MWHDKSLTVAVAIWKCGSGLLKNCLVISSVSWSYFPPPMPCTNRSDRTSRQYMVVVRARGRILIPDWASSASWLIADSLSLARLIVPYASPDSSRSVVSSPEVIQKSRFLDGDRLLQIQSGTSTALSIHSKAGTGCEVLRILCTLRYSISEAL